MVYTIDELRRMITPIAKKYGIPAIYLFGSYARGDATEDSDVDVLIEHKGSAIRGLWDLGAFYLDLNEGLGKQVDIVTLGALDQADTKRRSPHLKNNINRERVSIYEGQ